MKDGCELRAGPDVELAINLREVILDRRQADEQLLGDILVGSAAGG